LGLGHLEHVLKMFVERIEHSVGNAPEKKQACYQDKRDKKTIGYQFISG
jgi:hypothetical protein